MESFPECSVCKKPFKWKGPDPYLMPCLHAVCETCLTSAGTGCLHCPTCQRDVDLGKTTLKKDTVRQQLILNLTAKNHPNQILCTHEDDGNQAVCWCIDCGEYLCEHCQNLHASFKAMMGHTVSGIGELGSTGYDKETYCHIHKKYVLELFDGDCDTLICLKCTQGDHAGHSTEDVDTVSKGLREELETQVKAVGDLKRTAQSLIDDTDQHEIRLREAAVSQTERIKNTFDTLRDVVGQREKEAILELNTQLDKAKANTSERRSALNQHLRHWSDIFEYTQHVLDITSKSDLPSMFPLVKTTVAVCLNSDEFKETLPTVTFDATDLPCVKSTVSNFSRMLLQSTDVLEKTDERILLSYQELQQRCAELEEQEKEMKQTIQTLEREKKQTSVPQAVLESLGVRFLKQHEETHVLNCIDVKFSAHKVNQAACHINGFGELCISPTRGRYQTPGVRRLVDYRGTSSTFPLLKLECLQYWENIIHINVKQMFAINMVSVEIGLSVECEQDKTKWIIMQPNSYGMIILRLSPNHSMSRAVVARRKDVSHKPDTFTNKPGTDVTLHYGVLYSAPHRKLAYLDVKENEVIAVLDDVDTSQPLWPMFGVCGENRASVCMKLVTGQEIVMDDNKRSLILEAIS